MLVRYTYYGDTDLSGAVTLDDHTLFTNGYQNNGSTWIRGDLDYSGFVTLDDYTLFLKAYRASPPIGASARTAVAVFSVRGLTLYARRWPRATRGPNC